jgi:hypothetical protein
MGSVEEPDTRELVVNVSDGQYRIEDTAVELDDAWPETEDQLTTGEDRWMAVIAGVEWGPLSVVVDTGDESPAEDFSAWEAVAQRSIEVTGNVVHVLNTGGTVQHEIPLPRPGWYTVTVHARGRATRLGKGHDPNGAEEHLIRFRRADGPVPNRRLVGPDEFGTFY